MTLSEGVARRERGWLQELGPSQGFDITSFAYVGLSWVDRRPHTGRSLEAQSMPQPKHIGTPLEDSRTPQAGILES